MVQSHYKKLYLAHQNQINWVNYQFYTLIISSKDELKNLYHKLVNDYTHHNLLARFSTDPSDVGKFSREDFIKGCKDLINNEFLPGIFLRDASDSTISEPPFLLEKNAQKIFTRSDNN